MLPCCSIISLFIPALNQFYFLVNSLSQSENNFDRNKSFYRSASLAHSSKHYDETTTRQSDGRFVVEMPFKKPTPAFGDSFKQTRLRFEAQERRLQRNPGVKEQYKAFIKEFEDMGHLEEVPPDELDNGCENRYYLPHHAVFKESSTTTKLRVVFDGSAKTSSGVSLNDILMIGPVLQPNIFDLLIWVRLYKFGLTADVAQMYRQTALAKKQEDLTDFCGVIIQRMNSDTYN